MAVGDWTFELAESASASPEVTAFSDREWAAYDREHFGRGWDHTPFVLTARGSDGAVLGSANGWTCLSVGYLGEIIVAADQRGRGLGGALLAEVERVCRSRSATRLALRTEAGGAAQRLYERTGWSVEAVLTDWFAGLTYVQMRKDLAPAD